jgi:Gpi18-like mannosyltransferase
VILASRSPAELNSSQVVLAASSSVLLLPFILPGMHERYFYLADVLTVVAASFFPRELWMAPVLTQLGSFFSYLPFLVGSKRVVWPQWAFLDLRVLAVGVLVALWLNLRHTFREFQVPALRNRPLGDGVDLRPPHPSTTSLGER